MQRIYHTWDKWECYPAGFYEDKLEYSPLSKEELEKLYADFLSNDSEFKSALFRVISDWKNSCEHYLTNEKMNRIAWLGQAAACLAIGLPSCYRGGFHSLSQDQQNRVNSLALDALNMWLSRRGEKTLTMEEAASKTIS